MVGSETPARSETEPQVLYPSPAPLRRGGAWERAARIRADGRKASVESNTSHLARLEPAAEGSPPLRRPFLEG